MNSNDPEISLAEPPQSHPAPAPRTAAARLAVSAALAVASLLLAGLIVRHPLAAYIAKVAPSAALFLNANQPEALATLARHCIIEEANSRRSSSKPQEGEGRESLQLEMLGTGVIAGDTAGQSGYCPVTPGTSRPSIARDLARRAIIASPLAPKALIAAAQAEILLGQDDAALALTRQAAALSLHEAWPHLWLLQNVFERDTDEALRRIDIILRSHIELTPYLAPALTRLAEFPPSRPAVAGLLSQNPPYRTWALEIMRGSATSPATLSTLFEQLTAAGSPPKATEIAGYLWYLFGQKQYEQAYNVWLQSLPAGQLERTGFVFNGAFEPVKVQAPFDWSLSRQQGFDIRIGASTAAAEAAQTGSPGPSGLSVTLRGGHKTYIAAETYTILPPGGFTFAVSWQGHLNGPRGLVWNITCFPSQTRIAQSPMMLSGAKSWTLVSFPFTVPASDCQAQKVELTLAARSASEAIVDGTAWFRDLQIVRRDKADATRN